MEKEFLKRSPIGVFDSGFGGLEILREIARELPQYDYIYLGDRARAPYGSRSQEVVYGFTEQAVDFLFKRNCQLIILACNTVSSKALRRIQRGYLPKHYPDRRVLGVIIPAAEVAVEVTKNNRVGVIATEGTVNSGAFVRELVKLNPNIEVFQKACPLLVPIVESGEKDSKIARLALENYLKPLMEKDIDTLILGCTHYGLLKDEIRSVGEGEVNIVSEGKIVAEKLRDYLKRHSEMEGLLSKDSEINFFTTDLSEKFKSLGSEFFGKKIIPKKVVLHP